MKVREIHAHALKVGFGAVNNALIAYYTKCCKLDDVVRLFERMLQKDVITWTVARFTSSETISRDVEKRDGDKALVVWSEVNRMGLKPDPFTLAYLILSAYRHTKSNLFDNCLDLFHFMTSKYDIARFRLWSIMLSYRLLDLL
ncbi:Pentatricopeptide repeat-containing protein [Thalictrum thalictroides]|uniref:Pentatricopeptide repeat-containing protein n=1 Tax=Thalictrum thalictroides TaxID=46969 RepID=A0A7J6VTW0_THATH|nr:Pentatricopeptide repeat-containing protein [Thalictrum thalictroides]